MTAPAPLHTAAQQNNAAEMHYLDDVYSSDPGASSDYLIELTSEAFALTWKEAKAIYHEWSKRP